MCRSDEGDGGCETPQRNSCVVASLRERSFQSRPMASKLSIVANGPPQPEQMPFLSKKRIARRGSKVEEYWVHFKSSIYEKEPWVCGCAWPEGNSGGLYCWPCLLFNTSPNARTWKSVIFRDMTNLSGEISRHAKLESHLQAVLALSNFNGGNRIDVLFDHARANQISSHNTQVTRNRSILKKLIDVALHLAKLDIPFRGHDESVDSSNRGNFIETLHLLAAHDPELATHLKGSSVFQGTSGRIQNDLVDAIATVARGKMRHEIQQSPFVAVIADEATDTSKKSQACVVLRYIIKSKVVEHFVEFKDISEKRDAAGLCSVFGEVLDFYGVDESKLVGQGYDGAAVMSGVQNGLQRQMKDKYPYALYVHCLAHRLNLVIGDVLKDGALSRVRIFFCTLEGLPSYFSSPKRVAVLKKYTNRLLPANCKTRWTYKSSLINYVIEHRTQLVTLFTDMASFRIEGFSECSEIQQANGFASFLRKFENVFLLNVFSVIFERSDLLYRVLQKKDLDIQYCMKIIENSISYLENVSEEGLQGVWDSTTSTTPVPSDNSRRRGRPRSDGTVLSVQDACKELMRTILATTVTKIKDRFANFVDMKFVELLCSDKFEQYATYQGFPREAFESLESHFAGIFNFPKLKAELGVVYSDETLRGLALNKMLEKFETDRGLKASFREFVLLMQLIVCLPSTSVSAERAFSAMRRIKTYLRSVMLENRFSNLGYISIEKEFIVALVKENKEEFYNSVIAEFVKKDRRMDFQFR